MHVFLQVLKWVGLVWGFLIALVFVALTGALAMEAQDRYRARRRAAETVRTIQRLPQYPRYIVEPLSLGWDYKQIGRWFEQPSSRLRGLTPNEAWNAGYREMVVSAALLAIKRWRCQTQVRLASASEQVLAELQANFGASAPDQL